MNEKTREEILAEREAKKKAKINTKKKVNANIPTPRNDMHLPTSAIVESKSQEALSQPNVKNKKDDKDNKHEGNIQHKSLPPNRGLKLDGSKVTVQSITKHPSPSKLQPVSDSVKSAAQKPQRKPLEDPSVNELKESLGSKGVLGSEQKGVESISESKSTANVPSKAELKAARRLKQEMQRAAKVSQGELNIQKSKIETPISQELKEKHLQKKTPVVSVASKKNEPVKNSIKVKVAEHKVKLFIHLYNDDKFCISNSIVGLHPVLIGLGMQYANRVIVGSNARCFSLMNALKTVIEDYITPEQKEFARGLESSLQLCLAFLQRCRPLAVSMINATKHLKWQMTQLPNDVSDSEAKKRLQKAIDTYLYDQIDLAAKAICITVQKKISNGDVILTYGCSSLVQQILIEAHENGTKFRVVVVDARPLLEGLQLLRRLEKCGIRCSYVLVGAASCMMGEATKVLLGAHALLANGYVMSRAGTSQVALLAHAYNVPVLVCCETYKFCERVQTDAFVHNEIGNPDALVECRSSRDNKPLSNWRGIANLTPLNLTYDVTPPYLVTAVVTELAILPCTSVPVILRIKPSDSHH